MFNVEAFLGISGLISTIADATSALIRICSYLFKCTGRNPKHHSSLKESLAVKTTFCVFIFESKFTAVITISFKGGSILSSRLFAYG
jgi:hypothetical protein